MFVVNADHVDQPAKFLNSDVKKQTCCKPSLFIATLRFYTRLYQRVLSIIFDTQPSACLIAIHSSKNIYYTVLRGSRLVYCVALTFYDIPERAGNADF